MTKKLGMIGSVIGAAGMLVLPAVAQQRSGNWGGNRQGQQGNPQQQYSAPAYPQQNAAPPATQGYGQNYGQQYGNSQGYQQQYGQQQYRGGMGYGQGYQRSYGGGYADRGYERGYGARERWRRERMRRERWEHRPYWDRWR